MLKKILKIITTSLLLFSLVGVFSINASSKVTNNSRELPIQFPSNKSTVFSSPDEYYSVLTKEKKYEEFPNAKLNVRKLVLFKDVVKEEIKFKKSAGRYINAEKAEILLPHVSPERQVYFYASFSENETRTDEKLAVFDAKTGERLYDQNSHGNKKN